MHLRTFLSYATIDRHAAAVLKQHLERPNVSVFMAHEDIDVSEEWRKRLLSELRSTDLFVCLLSESYVASPWCLQESGIAVYRRKPVVPLRLDRTLPPGFLSAVQAIPFDPSQVRLSELGSAIVRADFQAGIDFFLHELASSPGFRDGEANLQALLPYVSQMTDKDRARLLGIAANTYRVSAANLCVTELLPPLIKTYGHLASAEDLFKLKRACHM